MADREYTWPERDALSETEMELKTLEVKMATQTDTNLFGYQTRHAETLRRSLETQRNPVAPVIPAEAVNSTIAMVDEYLDPAKYGAFIKPEAEVKASYIAVRNGELGRAGIAQTGAAEYETLVADALRAYRAGGRADSDFAKVKTSLPALKNLAAVGRMLAR
jgi:hypothetical protein